MIVEARFLENKYLYEQTLSSMTINMSLVVFLVYAWYHPLVFQNINIRSGLSEWVVLIISLLIPVFFVPRFLKARLWKKRKYFCADSRGIYIPLNIKKEIEWLLIPWLRVVKIQTKGFYDGEGYTTGSSIILKLDDDELRWLKSSDATIAVHSKIDREFSYEIHDPQGKSILDVVVILNEYKNKTRKDEQRCFRANES